MEKPTETQPRPNISTEHQNEGDARRPSDVLDRKHVKRDPIVLSRDFESRRICPEQQRRLAIHRVNVGTSSIDDLVRYYRISRLIINRQWMQK